MDREKLIKVGDPIRILRDRWNNLLASYYLVAFVEAPCGIAIYQYANQHCTAAYLTDVSGVEILIDHSDETHTYNKEDLKELYKIYSWAFA